MKKEGRKREIDDQFKQLCLVEIEIEHITGKEAIELVRLGKNAVDKSHKWGRVVEQKIKLKMICIRM